MAIILLSLAPVLVAVFAFLQGAGIGAGQIALLISVTIFATSITHTFLDFIPSTFLGAPEADTALSVLPAHKMLLQGDGYRAVVLSALGSFGAIVMAILLMGPFRVLIGNPLNLYEPLKKVIVFVLMGICFLMLITETTKIKYVWDRDEVDVKRKDKKEANDSKWREGPFSRTLGIACAVGLFLLAGLFGLVVLDLNISSPFGLPSSILFPTLSGLFGISTLLESVKQDSHVLPQNIRWPKVDLKRSVQSIVTGSFAGSVVGFLPGLSAGMAVCPFINVSVGYCN